MIFDSHAHYDDEEFDNDRDEIINSLKENNVSVVLNCGASLEGSYKTLELTEKYDFFYGAVGIHPEFANIINEEVIDKLREMAKFNKIRAIGEIGLDYYYEENPAREIQKKAFIRQMELAEEVKLPVILHIRDAYTDALEIMKSFKNVKGVVHCFSGSPEIARECLKLGYYIGFTGVVTFKNAKKIVDTASIVPFDRILVETDCPYMAPVPFRGKRNYSPYIKYIIERLSDIKGVNTREMEEYTTNNAKNLLNI
ncbi:MAG: TatD family hydrolase [Bacillota bacterium]|nr:TatD family hydrolase [Bacillota bacterium]